MHATEHDRELAEAYSRGFRDGLDSGGTSARATGERLQRRITELEHLLDEATRYNDVDGEQVVEVGEYAYRWHRESRSRSVNGCCCRRTGTAA